MGRDLLFNSWTEPTIVRLRTDSDFLRPHAIFFDSTYIDIFFDRKSFNNHDGEVR